MAMTKTDLDERARDRATSERLHTFKAAGEPLYFVRSRQTEPGSMQRVRIDSAGAVVHCTCAGWTYRQSCTHASAVVRRLEREHKGSKATVPAPEPIPFTSTSTRRTLYRCEAS